MTTDRMEALLFRYEMGRYLASRALHTLAPRLWSVRYAPLHHVRLARPVTQEPGWLRVRVRLSGICGTDLNMVTARDSLYLEPEATYPFVPGHEIVGMVEEPTAGRIAPGTRVAVWPVLGCNTRGTSPCQSCAQGWDGLCERRDDRWPGRGATIGFNRETGGGWAEACLAHESQLWPLADAISDKDALLLDPASAALAALLRDREPTTGRTLVIGGGTIGLLTAYLHGALGLSGSCELLVRYESQREWAEQHGISATTVRGDDEFRSWGAERGIRAKRVRGYGYVLNGSFDRVIDAAGTRTSVSWAIGAVRARGSVILVAAPRTLDGLDPTPLWYREITLRGIYQYGPVPWEGRRAHPYEVLIPRLADGTLRFRDWVTHLFPLRDRVEAFRVLSQRRESGAVKVAFRPGA